MDSKVAKDDQVMYGQIVKDYSKSSELEFWSKMIIDGFTWLYDERGQQPVSPLHLAADMSGLHNDFYRSLAYFVRTLGGYGKSNVSYAEFLWANWYRRMIPLPWPTSIPSRNLDASHMPRILEAPSVVRWNVCDVFPYEQPCLKAEPTVLRQVMNQAMSLALSPAASHLPGYNEGVKEEPHCDMNQLQETYDKAARMRRTKRRH